MKELGIAILIAAVIAVALPVTYKASGMGGAKELPAVNQIRGGNQPPGTGAGAAASPAAALTGVALGQQVATRSGCLGCHTTGAQSASAIAPTWKGLAGSSVPLEDGSTVTADDNYLHESIVTPNAKIVKGFKPGIMPQTFGTTLKPEEIDAVIAYIKTIK